jgi:hypothetical protein
MDRYERILGAFLELPVAMLWVEHLSLCQSMKLKQNMDI